MVWKMAISNSYIASIVKHSHGTFIVVTCGINHMFVWIYICVNGLIINYLSNVSGWGLLAVVT